MAQKLGAAVPLSVSLGLRPTSIPQYTNVTDRQTGQADHNRHEEKIGKLFYKWSPNNHKLSVPKTERSMR